MPNKVPLKEIFVKITCVSLTPVYSKHNFYVGPKNRFSLHANPLAQSWGTSKTGFVQVKIMKEYV
jgi:hypothetical protein